MVNQVPKFVDPLTVLIKQLSLLVDNHDLRSAIITLEASSDVNELERGDPVDAALTDFASRGELAYDMADHALGDAVGEILFDVTFV